MRYAISLPHFGPYADARLLAELAAAAEAAGWDGVFTWDHVAMAWPDPVVDTTVALTAIALATERVRFGPMVTPLARRRPWKVAREMATLDRLSGGRLTLGVGLGAFREEFDLLGEETDWKTRGDMLDEAIAVLRGLWSGEPFAFHGQHYQVETTGFTPTPLQQPIPIWAAAMWPGGRSFRRAAGLEGVAPLPREFDLTNRLSPAEVVEIVAFCDGHRDTSQPFDVVIGGSTPAADAAAGAAIVAPYAVAGATWWLEDVSPWSFGWAWQGPWPLAAMRERIEAGPPLPVS